MGYMPDQRPRQAPPAPPPGSNRPNPRAPQHSPSQRRTVNPKPKSKAPPKQKVEIVGPDDDDILGNPSGTVNRFEDITESRGKEEQDETIKTVEITPGRRTKKGRRVMTGLNFDANESSIVEVN